MRLVRGLFAWLGRQYERFLNIMAPEPLWTEEDQRELDEWKAKPMPKRPYAKGGRWHSGL